MVNLLTRHLMVAVLAPVAACCHAHLPPAPPPGTREPVRTCNLAQTACAVSDPRIPSITITPARDPYARWTLPLHAAHVLVSKGGGTLAVFAPPRMEATAATPFLTIYRRSGAKIEFDYGRLYPELLKTPDTLFPLKWGSVVEVNDNDDIAIRSARGELFKFSMKDED
ncbi:hypothetical protein ACG04Q_01270 [Roseateles sp. DXS20W]|uniref:Uncharacterized protein n=1 Tax=Pelomonas lactea TaxID=3299030 RepID=A0ABW7GE03_9BURK